MILMNPNGIFMPDMIGLLISINECANLMESAVYMYFTDALGVFRRSPSVFPGVGNGGGRLPEGVPVVGDGGRRLPGGGSEVGDRVGKLPEGVPRVGNGIGELPGRFPKFWDGAGRLPGAIPEVGNSGRKLPEGVPDFGNSTRKLPALRWVDGIGGGRWLGRPVHVRRWGRHGRRGFMGGAPMLRRLWASISTAQKTA